VTLPQIKRSWAEARDAAIEFDRLGFDSVWVCDHLYGVPLPSLPILEAWTELAAIAAVTERVGLGTLVTPPFFRNPAVLAKQIATLDQISNGRAIAGLGTGWFDAEFKGYGLPFPPVRERLRALEETIAILRLLWSEEKVSYEGRVFKLENAYCEPKPVKPPPILVGGGGEKVLLRSPRSTRTSGTTWRRRRRSCRERSRCCGSAAPRWDATRRASRSRSSVSS
jgi:alkanesulfonate monooxygenase SsuD/methylene tetrahydromethanopterin reductase-like flavin-dependent oxidoreductase (luciferase family)